MRFKFLRRLALVNRSVNSRFFRDHTLATNFLKGSVYLVGLYSNLRGAQYVGNIRFRSIGETSG